MKPINYGEIAHLEFFSTDLNETITVEFYLIRLLSTLWYKSHLFSGNRPFGNIYSVVTDLSVRVVGSMILKKL
jgi:hypothetical protein